MSKISKKDIKRHIINKFYENFTKYKQCLLVSLENVTSNQVQQIRLALRQQNKGDMVCGKNTTLKKAIDIRLRTPQEKDANYKFRKAGCTKTPQIKKFLQYCKGKVGFIFSDSPIHELKSMIENNRIPAPAKAGTIAPNDYILKPGLKCLDPSQIAFLHALCIPIQGFKLLEKGRKIGKSEAAFLEKFGIKPFTSGMEILYVYDDGIIMTPEIFNIEPEAILNKFKSAVSNITAISLAIGHPNVLSVPHMIINGLKDLASIALATDIKIRVLEGASFTPTTSESIPTVTNKTKKQVAWLPPLKQKVEEEQEIELGDIFGDDF